MGLKPLGGRVAAEAWTPLSLTGFSTRSGYFAPAVRLEGDLVRFRGCMTASTAYTFDTLIATLATRFRPTASVVISTRHQGGVSSVAVTTAGVLTLTTAVTSGQWVALDGLTFTTS